MPELGIKNWWTKKPGTKCISNAHFRTTKGQFSRLSTSVTQLSAGLIWLKTASMASTNPLDKSISTLNTLGRLVFRLFRVMALVACTDFIYLAFSLSTCFLNASVLARLSVKGCLGLKLESSPSSPVKLPLSFLSISARDSSSFCNLFSAFSYFRCRLYSSSCWTTIEWMAEQRPFIASEAACMCKRQQRR